MESVRQQKVSRLLQKEISTIFQQNLGHLSHGNMVSVTVVRIAPDLGFAKIYVSIFPEKEPQKLVEVFNEHLGEVTRLLYPRIKNQFRKMPEIRFYHDDSLDYADRINQLLPD
ncbi:MAG: 30S ribosome-binding factor RbfA [Flavobacteriales bacterium]